MLQHMLFPTDYLEWPLSIYTRDCSGKQNKALTVFLDLGPSPGPGRLPLDSARRDVELASVFASVAPVAVSFMPESIFWNLVKKKHKK